MKFLFRSLPVIALAAGSMTVALNLRTAKSEESPQPAAPEPLVELAPYMTELQQLTHKLSLSVANSNHDLALFYLYESLEVTKSIKEEVPEYRSLPIALLADRLATPAYEKLRDAIQEDKDASTEKLTNKASALAMTALVNSCNQCHTATQHSFIRITDRSDFNPFNQDFTPAP